MPAYVVTWELNREKPNYNAARDAFVKHIDRYTHVKDNGLDSVRFISTSWTATQIRDDLKTKLDANDRLFICQINKGQNDGWLDKAVWDWITSKA